MAVVGLVIINLNTNAGDANLISVGSLCFFLPGIVAYILAGYSLLNYRSWARILVIILAILNLVSFPIGTAIGSTRCGQCLTMKPRLSLGEEFSQQEGSREAVLKRFGVRM